MRRLRGVVPVLVSSALALALAAGTAAASPVGPGATDEAGATDGPGSGAALASPSAPPAPRYVALGDSWTAGTAAGALDGASADCRRSTLAHPVLLAEAAGEPSWVSQACATRRPGTGNAQFATLGPQTRVITTTIGADAVRVGELARACSRTGTPAACDDAAATTDELLAALPRALDGSLRELRDLAPTTVLLVAGYPLITEGRTCDLGAPDTARADRVDAAVVELDRILAARATAWGGTFVDVRPAFAGHGACSDEPWVTPLTDPDPRVAGAATAEGHARGYAAALQPAVSGALTTPPVPAVPAPAPADPAPAGPVPADPVPADPEPSAPAPSDDDTRAGPSDMDLFADAAG